MRGANAATELRERNGVFNERKARVSARSMEDKELAKKENLSRGSLNKKNINMNRLYKAFLVFDRGNISLPVYILRFHEEGAAEVIVRLVDENQPEDVMQRLEEGSRVLLKVDAGGGGMDVYSATVSYQLNTWVHLTRLVLRERLQRRAEVKVPMEQQGVIVCREENRKGREYPVRFRDISAGGVGFVVSEINEEIGVGDVFNMCFDRGKKPFNADFRICRCSVNEDGTVSYGAHFLNLNLTQESEIRKYAFEVERQEILRLKRIQELLEEMEELREMEKHQRENQQNQDNQDNQGDVNRGE